jgi:hypothetical protein
MICGGKWLQLDKPCLQLFLVGRLFQVYPLDPSEGTAGGWHTDTALCCCVFCCQETWRCAQWLTLTPTRPGAPGGPSFPLVPNRPLSPWAPSAPTSPASPWWRKARGTGEQPWNLDYSRLFIDLLRQFKNIHKNTNTETKEKFFQLFLVILGIYELIYLLAHCT